MKIYSISKYLIFFLTTIIILFIPLTPSLSEENVFTINNIKVKGTIDVNFTREKYFNRAFSNSFEILMNKILLTRDLKKIEKVKLEEIKKLISNFQILEESYSEGMYKANIKISYSENKIKDFLGKKNISFSSPENISAVFFPVFFIDDKMQNFEENYFYTNWLEVKIKNELINFILPIEDLDDIAEIIKMKNNIEELDVFTLANKYDQNNYVFVLMSYEDKNLNIYIKTNFNNNKTSKNILYKVKNIRDESELNIILKDLKLKVTDLWKEQNLVNLLMPLTLKVKYKHLRLKDLNKIRNVFYKIGIIDNFTLKEFNINNSVFKIYYYGNPKKLRSELLKFGYELKNNQGSWQIYLNE